MQTLENKITINGRNYTVPYKYFHSVGEAVDFYGEPKVCRMVNTAVKQEKTKQLTEDSKSRLNTLEHLVYSLTPSEFAEFKPAVVEAQQTKDLSRVLRLLNVYLLQYTPAVVPPKGKDLKEWLTNLNDSSLVTT